MTNLQGSTSLNQWSPVRIAALAIGLVFLVVGVLGFIPGVTTDYDMMEFAGHHSGAQLFGVFTVSVLHNIVHLVFGVVGLIAARSAVGARGYLLGGGIVYLLLAVYGVLVDQGSSANFVPLNNADNWLHFGLGLGMVACGVLLPRLSTSTHGTYAHR